MNGLYNEKKIKINSSQWVKINLPLLEVVYEMELHQKSLDKKGVNKTTKEMQMVSRVIHPNK